MGTILCDGSPGLTRSAPAPPSASGWGANSAIVPAVRSVAAAKVIKNFRKEDDANEKLEFKCGLLKGEVLSAKQVENELATLPGKDELRAMLLAQLMAPMQQLVMQLNAPAQNLGYVLEAVRRKREEEG